MEPTVHALSDLFRQLGLPDDSAGIEAFISAHRPLPDTIALADAPFWTAAQAGFLSEEVGNDADWAEIIDMLDARLRR